jgi:acetyl esterase/lipase
MKHLHLFSILIHFLSFHAFSQQYSSSWKDVNYTGDTTVSHRMDIYLPQEVKEKYPAIVLIYGSAFFGNDMKHIAFETLGAPLLHAGFAVIAINHRSSREAIFPAQIHDVKAAIRFIRAKAQEYQIDTTFIGITGYSSGGHLSAFAGSSGRVGRFSIGNEQVDLEGSTGNYLGFSSSVDAVVDWFGPTDFLIMDSCGSTMTHDAYDSPESILVGGPIHENSDKVKLANPITYVDSDDPPFLIFHGDKDPLVPYCQSEKLYEALQQSRVKSQLVIIPDGKHGPGVFEEKYFGMMVDFFSEELGQ